MILPLFNVSIWKGAGALSKEGGINKLYEEDYGACGDVGHERWWMGEIY